ncbi:extensin family protein [Brevundimonas sp. PAMC22021]|nr:extensin family protein [Brevundimonas sp. PAMC22021]
MRMSRRACVFLAVVVALAGCVRTPPAERAGAVRPTRVEAPLVGGLIDRAIDGGTRGAVSRAASDLQPCAAELTAARVRFSPVPDRVDTETCGLTNAGVLGADLGTVARMAPGDVTMTCETALALSVWRRQSLEPAAREILGSDVVQIDHFGVYACRPVNNGRGSTRPSAHGRAAALDFAGVRLRDGRRITVAADWSGDDAEARFLRRIRDDACRIFGTTLSPDYNAVHHDHLHLEAGRPGLCS